MVLEQKLILIRIYQNWKKETKGIMNYGAFNKDLIYEGRFGVLLQIKWEFKIFISWIIRNVLQRTKSLTAVGIHF